MISKTQEMDFVKNNARYTVYNSCRFSDENSPGLSALDNFGSSFRGVIRTCCSAEDSPLEAKRPIFKFVVQDSRVCLNIGYP